MINMLGHHVNKLVLVSIPSIFADSEPHICKLVGIEPSGLWLESEDLTRTIFPNTESGPVKNVFIPFAQIAYLVEDTTTRPVPTPSHKSTATIPSGPRRNAPTAANAKRKR